MLSILFWPLIILVIIIVCGMILAAMFRSRGGDISEETPERKVYQYTAKKFFMTRAEHDFYNCLKTSLNDTYTIFAQVHLPSIVDHKVQGQKRDLGPAFSHINGKSVDFVLCDNDYLSPKLVIELDDRTHELPQTIERDLEKERILKMAGLSLLRIQNHGTFDAADIANRVHSALSSK